MNIKKLSDTLHILGLKFGGNLSLVKAKFEEGKRGDDPEIERLMVEANGLSAKMGGMLYAASLLLNEDEMKRFIYRPGIIDDKMVAETVANIEKSLL